MKKLLRCKKCKHRVIYRSIGFIRKDKHVCSFFDMHISLEDGCTFGTEGPPQIGSDAPDVYLIDSHTCDKGGPWF